MEHGRTAAVRDDHWPGGRTFENLGHEPVTVFSRSELKREMQARGLQECVRHVPTPGSDRSPFTENWAATISPYSIEEAKRLVERVTGGDDSGASLGVPDPPEVRIADEPQQIVTPSAEEISRHGYRRA